MKRAFITSKVPAPPRKESPVYPIGIVSAMRDGSGPLYEVVVPVDALLTKITVQASGEGSVLTITITRSGNSSQFTHHLEEGLSHFDDIALLALDRVEVAVEGETNVVLSGLLMGAKHG